MGNKLVGETKTRSLVKTVVWRVIAVLNSYLVLTINWSEDNLYNALYMNITGFVVYYVYERLCNKITYGVSKE